MDSTEIRNKATKLQSKLDLLTLLNQIKEGEHGASSYPITMKQLLFWCNPNNHTRRYTNFRIAKKTGGYRTISAPNKSLKCILKYVNILLQSVYTPSEYAMGFVPGRSIVDNAQSHVGKNYVLNLDLQDFFPSIQQARVWKRLQLEPFNFPVEVANVLVGLCSMRVEPQEGEDKNPSYVLPQGAPTSPILTNAICDRLDRKLAGLAKRFGCTYTRYADDITFSSNHNVYQIDGVFMEELRRIIDNQHFKVNEKKTRLQKKGNRQETTGLILSDKVNVTRKYVRQIRMSLYIWERYGYGIANERYLSQMTSIKPSKKDAFNLDNILSGKLEFMKMVKSYDDSTYMTLKRKYDMLMDKTFNAKHVAGCQMEDNNRDLKTEYGFTYLETWPLIRFEQIIGSPITVVGYRKAEDGTYKPCKPYAFFMLDNEKYIVSMSHRASISRKEMLEISLCQSDVKKFWMMHRVHPKDRNKMMSVAARNTEPAVPEEKTLDQVLNDLYKSNFDLNILCQTTISN